MNLATAFVEIRADGNKGKADVTAFVADAASRHASISLGADNAKAKEAIAQVEREIAAAKGTVPIDADDKKAQGKLDVLKSDIGDVHGTVKVDADDEASAPIRSIKERADGLEAKDRTVVLRAEAEQAKSEISKIDRALQDPTLDDKQIRLLIDQRNEATHKIDDIKKDLGELPAAAEKSASGVAKKFAQVFGAAVFIKGIHDTIDAASDFNETVSKTEVIFGESGKAITAWANNSAKQFGLSKTAALDAVSTFATFGKGAGLAGNELSTFSEKLVGLSSDLASFYNTSPQQAIDAIGAALRGESEPIRQYGVLLDDATLKQRAMTMGLYTGKGVLDQHAKVLAAQAEILKQTSDAQGDFVRTSDGLANSQRIAAAEAQNASISMGQSFLPVYQSAVKVVGALATGFGELPAPVQTAVIGLLGLVALSGPIGSVVEVSKSLRKALVDVAEDGTKSLSGLGKAVGGVGVALGIAGVAFAAYELIQSRAEEGAKRSAKVTEDVVAALDDEVAAIVKLRRETDSFITPTESAVDAQKAFNKSLLEGGDNGDKLTKALGVLGLGGQDAAKILRGLQTDTKGWISSQLQAKGATKEVADSIAGSLSELDDWTSAWNRMTTATTSGSFGDVNDGAASAFDDLTTSLGLSKTEVKAMVQAFAELDDRASETHIDKIASQFLTTAAGADQASASLVSQAEALAGTTRNADDAYNVYVQYIALLERSVGTVTAWAGEAARLGTAAASQVGPLDDVTKSMHAAGEAAREGNDAEEDYAAGTKAAADAHATAVDTIIKSIDDERTAFDLLASAANDLRSAIDKVFNPTLNMEEANRAAQKATDDLTQAFKDNGKTLDIGTEKGRANREQIESSVKSILDYAAAAAGAGATNDQVSASVDFMTQNLRNQLTQAGLTDAQINDYLTTLGLTPDNVTTAITLAGNEAAKTELKNRQDQLNGLDAGATAEIQALVDAGKYQQALDLLNQLTKDRTSNVFVNYVDKGVGYEKNAGGTTNASPGWHLVGDDPRKGGSGELINFGQGGGQVKTAAQSRSMLNDITSRPQYVDAAGMPGETGPGSVSISVGDINGGDWLHRLVDGKLGELVAAIKSGPKR